MITEDYVSFETAKLLKEKGFDEPCECLYDTENNDVSIVNGWMDTSNSELEEKEFACYSAPTLQMAMKWLREVHKIDMWIECHNSNRRYKGYIHSEQRGDEALFYEDTYEEACEAAIKYCLKNLIKNEDEEKQSDIPVPKTIDEAISTLEKILSDEDREYLLKNGAISMHNSLGRWIRNEWGLWTGSELKDELMNMNKGLNHPDDMSNYIIEEFIKYWNNKL